MSMTSPWSEASFALGVMGWPRSGDIAACRHRAPCRAAVVPHDPELRGRDHPPAPQVDRFAVAEAGCRVAGAPGARLPAEGRHVRRAGGRVRVGTATAWRYVNETVDLLAARAPKLREAVRDAQKAGHAYVVVDGTR